MNNAGKSARASVSAFIELIKGYCEDSSCKLQRAYQPTDDDDDDDAGTLFSHWVESFQRPFYLGGHFAHEHARATCRFGLLRVVHHCAG